MIDPRQHAAEEFAIVDHASYGDATEPDAVISLLASDQSLASAFPAYAVISDCNLERGVYRFRTRVREKDMIQIAGCDFSKLFSKSECRRMSHLEGRRVVELLQLV